MTTFYQYHQQGMTKAEALHQTQMVFLHGSGSLSEEHTGNTEDRGAVIVNRGTSNAANSYTHPYYWAPFILMGNFL
jgi:CHAT domain-containing protein